MTKYRQLHYFDVRCQYAFIGHDYIWRGMIFKNLTHHHASIGDAIRGRVIYYFSIRSIIRRLDARHFWRTPLCFDGYFYYF